MKKPKFNWAVFNTETRFRLTEYNTHTMAILAKSMILNDQPELRGKIAVKQRNFETKQNSVKTIIHKFDCQD